MCGLHLYLNTGLWPDIAFRPSFSIMLWCFGILLVQETFKKGLLYTFNCIAGQMNRTYQSGIILISDAGTGATIFFVLCFCGCLVDG